MTQEQRIFTTARELTSHRSLGEKLLSDKDRNALAEFCKDRNLSTYGTKIELAKRIVNAYSWNELLRILFTIDGLEWWQLLFLRPMMKSGATRKEILDDEFVTTVFKEILKSFNSDRGNFLDRKMKFLLRSGLVVRNREGRKFRYLINEPLQAQLKSALTNLKLQQVVQRYQKSAEYEFFQKYHEPELSLQNTTSESNLEGAGHDAVRDVEGGAHRPDQGPGARSRL